MQSWIRRRRIAGREPRTTRWHHGFDVDGSDDVHAGVVADCRRNELVGGGGTILLVNLIVFGEAIWNPITLLGRFPQ